MRFKWKVCEPQSVPDQHMLRIARKTMNLSCIGCLCMGGPNHYAAAETIHRLTGVFVQIEAGCTCNRELSVKQCQQPDCRTLRAALDSLRSALFAAHEENEGNNQIESDLLALEADRDSLCSRLDEAVGLLRALDPCDDIDWERIAAFLARNDDADRYADQWRKREKDNEIFAADNARLREALAAIVNPTTTEDGLECCSCAKCMDAIDNARALAAGKDDRE